MSGRAQILADLRQVCAGADEAIDLGEAALLLAAFDRPRVARERYQIMLADLINEVTIEMLDAPPVVTAQAHALARAIAGSEGYIGDEKTYDDQQNANLMRVMDRKRGLPVTLGILYIHCGRAQGWSMEPLSFPGHFLVRIAGIREHAIIDPFYGGKVLTAQDLRQRYKELAGASAELQPEFFHTVSNRDVLLRLQNNIKTRALTAGKLEQATAILETMIAIAPDNIPVHRELGMAHVAAGNLKGAIAILTQAQSLAGQDSVRQELADLLSQIQSRLN